jgi:hypothetical protein
MIKILYCFFTIFLAISWTIWPGSSFSYLAFFFSFTTLLFFGITRRPSIGYLLLSIILSIGYLLKLTLRMIGGTFNDASKWVEPIGRFSFSASAWDDVALISSVGALGVLCAGQFWRRRIDDWQVRNDIAWYTPGMRIGGWAIVLGATALVVVLNETFHIFHGGLRPALHMPWPMHGLFGWAVSVGIILGAMVLIHLDILAKRSLYFSIILFVAVSSALSITTFSRGTLVLQSLPLLTTLILFRKLIPWLTRWNLLGIVAIFVCGLLLTVFASEQRRANNVYAKVQNGVTMQNFAVLIRRLSVDRWVGLEGVMAVSSYPGKSNDLLIRAAKERREMDNVDLYTGDVSLSGFQDTSKYQFATLPGMFAFLYYSGSFLVVFFGTAVLTSIVIAVEHGIRRVTQNPILAGQVGGYAAIMAVQLGGGGLVQPASVLAFTVAVALTLGFLVKYRMSFAKV